MMKRLALVIALFTALSSNAQQRRNAANDFASDFQTIPVAGNTPGAQGARFQTYVALLNPTSSAYAIEATLYDTNGTPRTATINMAANELKVYPNFLESVFGFTGGGAVTLRAPNPSNRFIVNVEVWTTGARYGTSIPSLEFAGSDSRSFAAGISTDSINRTNVGCFNQSGAANSIRATVFDRSGTQNLGTFTLNLPPHAWGQTAVTSIVTDGFVQFDPQDAAVCYAVIVNNTTNDGRFVSATEYRP